MTGDKKTQKDDLKFIDQCLEEHNRLRALHGAAPLRLNSNLSQGAREWANQLLQADHLQNSVLSLRGDIGENISMRSKSQTFGSDDGSIRLEVKLNAEEVVQQWYSDIEKYDFARCCGGPADNFTQLVWAGSKEVGIGRAWQPGKCIVVAHYKPAGNIRGQYEKNVFPGSNTASNTGSDKASGKMASTSSFSAVGRAERGGDENITKKNRSVRKERRVDENGREFTVQIEQFDYVDADGMVNHRVTETEIHENTKHSSRDSPFNDGKKKNDEQQEQPRLTGRRTESFSSDDGFERRIEKMPLRQINSQRKLRKFVRQVVVAHNEIRAKHRVASLRHSTELDTTAQKWADHLIQGHILSNSNTVVRKGRVGESIASRWSNDAMRRNATATTSASVKTDEYDGKELVLHWLEEQEKYDFTREASSIQGIGNFTQMVWKNTTHIGVGRAEMEMPNEGGYKIVIVVHYYPPGNIFGQFQQNVFVAAC